MDKYMYLDFEYRKSKEEIMELIACVVMTNYGTPVLKLDLRQDKNKTMLKSILERVRKTNILICFSGLAEGSGLYSLGLNPALFNWIDLQVAHIMFNNNPLTELRSVGGLVACCKQHGVIYQHAVQKGEIRNLILSKNDYTEQEMKEILDYCEEDVFVLTDLFPILVKKLALIYNTTEEKIIIDIKNQSKYTAALSVCERIGIPLRGEMIQNLIKNYEMAKRFLIDRNTYPFYQYNPKDDQYHKRYDIFSDYIKTNGFASTWPLTDSGMFSADAETLNDKKNLSPELNTLQLTEKLLQQFKCFNPKNVEIFEYMGSKDNRLRPYFAPHGTHTGRNAPPAKGFIFAMSEAFRALLDTDNIAITEIDWSAQEFAIAAVLSEDPVMIAAYLSGDPYMFLCIEAGAAPKGATKKTHKLEREIFKVVGLGVQYGMGSRSLAADLTFKLKKEYTEAEAKALINLHKKVFKDYWRWKEKHLTPLIERGVPLKVIDGWRIQTDPDPKYIRSLLNFMVQGTGAAMLRIALIKAVGFGLKVISPLHDAIYIQHDPNDLESPRILSQCMDEACKIVLKDKLLIRQEPHTYYRQQWTMKKPESEEVLEALKPFLLDKTENIVLSKPIMDKYEILNLMEW